MNARFWDSVIVLLFTEITAVRLKLQTIPLVCIWYLAVFGVHVCSV